MPAKSSTAVVYLTPTKFWVGLYGGKDPELYEVDWDGEDLVTPFTKMAEQFDATRARVILGQSLAQMVVLKFAADKLSRPAILNYVRDLFAEDIRDLSFDWRQISQDDDSVWIEVVAAASYILTNLIKSSEAAGIELEAVKPISTLLAQQTAQEKNPHLILWRRQEALALLSYQGVAYQVRDVETYAAQRLNAILKYNEEHAGLAIEKAITDWQDTSLDKTKPVPDLPAAISDIEIQPMDVFQFFSNQKLETGTDAQILDLITAPEKEREHDSTSKESETSEKVVAAPVAHATKMPIKNFVVEGKSAKKSTNWLAILVIFMITAAATAGGGYVFLSRSEPTPTPASEPTPQPTALPSPTPEPVVVTELSVQILNGSGIPGEAGRVATALETPGFENVVTGNAANYDFTDTTVALKPDVPEAVFELIRQSLSDYAVVQTEALAEDSDHDVVITVGATKNEAGEDAEEADE